MTRVVLDTNVVVSAAIRAAGNEAAVLKLVTSGSVLLFVTRPILAEYAAVLARHALGIEPASARALLAAIRAVASLVVPIATVAISPDPADNRFLECAEAATAADYLSPVPRVVAERGAAPGWGRWGPGAARAKAGRAA